MNKLIMIFGNSYTFLNLKRIFIQIWNEIVNFGQNQGHGDHFSELLNYFGMGWLKILTVIASNSKNYKGSL